MFYVIKQRCLARELWPLLKQMAERRPTRTIGEMELNIREWKQKHQ
jgi:hypothetical protein